MQKDGLHLSVAYDLTCFMKFFGFEKQSSKSTSMRLWIAPSFRSRRAVQKDGPHLSVAYDLTCFMTFFGRTDARSEGRLINYIITT